MSNMALRRRPPLPALCANTHLDNSAGHGRQNGVGQGRVGTSRGKRGHQALKHSVHAIDKDVEHVLQLLQLVAKLGAVHRHRRVGALHLVLGLVLFNLQSKFVRRRHRHIDIERWKAQKKKEEG